MEQGRSSLVSSPLDVAAVDRLVEERLGQREAARFNDLPFDDLLRLALVPKWSPDLISEVLRLDSETLAEIEGRGIVRRRTPAAPRAGQAVLQVEPADVHRLVGQAIAPEMLLAEGRASRLLTLTADLGERIAKAQSQYPPETM